MKAKTPIVALSILSVLYFTITSSLLGAQPGPSDSQGPTTDPLITNQADLESRSSEFNSENLTGGLLEVKPSDFSTLMGQGFEVNTKKIANELGDLTNEELSAYPITSLSSDDIKSVLGFLNEHDLMRLLLSIPQEDVNSISNMLGPVTLAQVLDKLSEGNRTQVLNRFSNSTVTLR